uniref:Endonuclease/exonuclease/phosphatase domain-containing protein n=1 Tax=Aegilops tauschii subsp. strangulata TaxID=200361 RepID=A0A453QIW6_AEGTS
MGFSGYPYTYDNGRSGNANVQVRLDRAVADLAWRNIFSDAAVQHLVSPCSDHCPILVRCLHESDDRPRMCCRYEVMWERDPGLTEVVDKAWKEQGVIHGLADVNKALNLVMKKLQGWSRKKFGTVTRELEKSRSRLEELMNMNADRAEIRKEADHMNELLYREEMLWRQRSRIDWLKEGDRNTKFFQQKGVWRARRNKIKHLVDDEGVKHDDQAGMGRIAMEYFQQLFDVETDLNQEAVVHLFEKLITDDMNEKLCQPF